MKRSTESTMRASLEFMSSLVKPNTTTPPTVDITMNALPPPPKPAKSTVIDWQLSKVPEMINVNALTIHYTSLRDITFNTDSIVLYSCGGGGGGGGGGVTSPRTRMKNRLVEQAARAYLQPLNVETKHTSHFLPWNWQKLMSYRPLTFSMNLLPTTYGKPSGYESSPGCFMGFISSFVKKLSFSGTLKYLLGRRVKQPVRFLQPRRMY